MNEHNERSEHELLKEICDKIGYNIKNKDIIRGKVTGKNLDVSIRYNIREIIFTQEFMNKIWEYVGYNNIYCWDCFNDFSAELINNLNNPVQYLYNLLFNNN